MLQKIVSGGQTGADIAGIDAAIDAGVQYGGWLPKGRKTEDGPLDEKYKMVEMPRGGYPKRTEQNVIDSDGTVIFVNGKLTGGSALTKKMAVKHRKPWLHLDTGSLTTLRAAEKLSGWLKKNSIKTLNVAGRCASKDPEMYQIVRDTVGIILE